MATRFLVFLGAGVAALKLSAESAQGVAGLVRVIDDPCCLALISGDHLDARDQRSLLIGVLFNRAGNSRITALQPDEAEKICATRGASLTRECWGDYFAVVRDRDSDDFTAVRDPLGSMPVYYCQRRDCIVFGSDADLFLQAGLISGEPDWSSIPRNIAFRDLRVETTWLAGLNELPAGCAFAMQDGRAVIEQRWNPWDYVNPADELRAADLASELEKVVVGAIRARASTCGNILVTLSGGLDSAIVAASLADVADVSAVTMVTDEPAGDERVYARAVVDLLALALRESRYDLGNVDLFRPVSPHLPVPIGKPFFQCVDHAVQTAVSDVGANAIFNGSGGDNVFCAMTSATPLVDRVRHEGVGPGAWKSLVDICALTGASAYRVGAAAIERATRPAMYAWQGDFRLLNLSAVNTRAPAHPWLVAPEGALPGKAVHIAKILKALSYAEGRARTRSATTWSPLMCQPVVETCLAIPTWRWTANGYDREIARRAFSHRLPGSVAWRKSKGGPDSFSARLFQERRDDLKGLMLDGLLSERKILDRTKIEAMLADPAPPRDPIYLRLLGLSDTEAWLRSWIDRATVGVKAA